MQRYKSSSVKKANRNRVHWKDDNNACNDRKVKKYELRRILRHFRRPEACTTKLDGMGMANETT